MLELGDAGKDRSQANERSLDTGGQVQETPYCVPKIQGPGRPQWGVVFECAPQTSEAKKKQKRPPHWI